MTRIVNTDEKKYNAVSAKLQELVGCMLQATKY